VPVTRPIGCVDLHRGRWRVRLRLPDGTRRPFLAGPEVTTREQAEAWRDALVADLRGSAYDPTQRGRTLGAWALTWLDDRERTHRDAAGDRQRWGCYWREDPIAAVSLRALAPSALLDAGTRLVARGLARQTTRNAWGTLRACLSAAVHARELAAERAADLLTVQLPPLAHAVETESEERWTWLRLDELLRVLALPLTDEARAAFLLGVMTGLRAGELHALRWTDLEVDVHIPQIVVARSRSTATKGGRVGRVRLLDPAIGVLRWYAARRGVDLAHPPSSLLWPARAGGMHARGYDWGWPELRAAAGLRDDVTWHDATRHTCASHLLQGTWVPMGWTDRPLRLEEVRVWLRHSSIDVTQRYAHLSLESLPVTTARTGHALRGQLVRLASLLGPALGSPGSPDLRNPSRPRELNSGPTVYETGSNVPRLHVISGGGTPTGPADLAVETLAAIAAEDAERALSLALRLALAVSRDVDFSPAIPSTSATSRK
jgi:integrase